MGVPIENGVSFLHSAFPLPYIKRMQRKRENNISREKNIMVTNLVRFECPAL